MSMIVDWSTGAKVVRAMTPQEEADATTAPDPRPAASLDRAAFCKALRRLGVLTPAEAVIAAQGGWPASFAAFTAALPADLAADAQIDWAAAANIHYAAPLLQQLALVHAGGDQAQASATLDAIFGIS